MYLNQIAPSNALEYIPDGFLVNVIPYRELVLSAIDRLPGRMNMDEYISFASGAIHLHEVVKFSDEEKEKGNNLGQGVEHTTWFSTNEIVDVRVLFRKSRKSEDLCTGSKVRVFSMEGDKNNTEEFIKGIDTGFLKYNFNSNTSDMVFQNALASTMLYKGLYHIGSPAFIRKVNAPAPAGSGATSYRSLTAIKTKYSKDFDRRRINHIMHPACFAAGVDDPDNFFGKKFLDDFFNALSTSRDVEELRESMKFMGDIELFDDDIDEIIETTTREAAEISVINANKNPDYDNESPGISVVKALEIIKEIIDADYSE